MANAISMENFLHTREQIRLIGKQLVKELLHEKMHVDQCVPTLPTVHLREQAVMYSHDLLMEAHTIAKAHHFDIRCAGNGLYEFHDRDRD